MSEPSAAFVRVWRMVKERHLETAFDGEGARIYGGRWNSIGHRVVYTSTSLALASLETLVHLDNALPLPRFIAFSVHLSADDIATAVLPGQYSFPGPLPHLTETRRIGDEWLKAGRHLALSVPSAIVPQEFNLLLNPAHPRFAQLVIATPVGFAIDPRLRR
ncbi:RES family NAD+ phosphorylase [Rariglobus hedericola]|uniref:RES domain-containing protein n=1 Tax=Rariglobus hedericola TaxID=2597822 RepID=A0A556QMP4_9BACT|nr:RES family NAD+ phosphorylase [Rariglobus hedericola]TSJ77905.1 RES domain-containing protein [Rariglobus hedericola]